MGVSVLARIHDRGVLLGAAAVIFIAATTGQALAASAQASLEQLLTGGSSREWVFQRILQSLGPGDSCVSGETYTFAADHSLVVHGCKDGHLDTKRFSWRLTNAGNGDTALVVDGLGTFLVLFRDAPDGAHQMRLRTLGQTQTQPTVDKKFRLDEDVKSPSPIATELQLSDIDVALGKFIEGNVAFVAPDRTTIGKSQIVEARLSVTKPPSALISELTESGKKESASLRVGDKMAATLNGGGAFDVLPSGPQVQFISHTYTTMWTWTITPKQAGPQFLILTFDAILTIDGKEGVRTINTLRRKIDVEVGWPETFDEWLDYGKKLFEGLNWLWATVLVPIAAYVAHFWKRKRDHLKSNAFTPSRKKARRQS